MLAFRIDHGADAKHLFKTFYGYEPSYANDTWREASAFSSCVLTPLKWVGMLDAVESTGQDGLSQGHHVKTQLFRAVLELDTENMLMPL